MSSLSHNLSHSPSCLQNLMLTTPQMRKSEGCAGTEKRKELETDIMQKSKGNMINSCYFMYILWEGKPLAGLILQLKIL